MDYPDDSGNELAIITEKSEVLTRLDKMGLISRQFFKRYEGSGAQHVYSLHKFNEVDK